MAAKKKKTPWQGHHITYEPERVVRVTRGEHYYLTRLQWFKEFSDGMCQALLYLIKTKPRREEET